MAGEDHDLRAEGIDEYLNYLEAVLEIEQGVADMPEALVENRVNGDLGAAVPPSDYHVPVELDELNGGILGPNLLLLLWIPSLRVSLLTAVALGGSLLPDSLREDEVIGKQGVELEYAFFGIRGAGEDQQVVLIECKIDNSPFTQFALLQNNE
jgi:hypothetical protein